MSQDNRLLPLGALDRSIDRPLADFVQAKPYGVSGAEPTTIRDYLFVILKRKWLILSLVLVVTSLVTILAYRAPSIYQGESTIRIEQKTRNILATQGIVITGQGDPNFWGTQLKLLQNPALARQVVLTLDLQHDPNFLGGQGQSSVFASLKRIFSRDKPIVASTPSANSESQPVGEDELKVRQFTAEELA